MPKSCTSRRAGEGLLDRVALGYPYLILSYLILSYLILSYLPNDGKFDGRSLLPFSPRQTFRSRSPGPPRVGVVGAGCWLRAWTRRECRTTASWTALR